MECALVAAGGAVVVPPGVSVCVVPLTPAYPLATIASITFPAGTSGDTLRLSFLGTPDAAGDLVLVVGAMPPPVDPLAVLLTVKDGTQGTTWYFSPGVGGAWVRA